MKIDTLIIIGEHNLHNIEDPRYTLPSQEFVTPEEIARIREKSFEINPNGDVAGYRFYEDLLDFKFNKRIQFITTNIDGLVEFTRFGTIGSKVQSLYGNVRNNDVILLNEKPKEIEILPHDLVIQIGKIKRKDFKLEDFGDVSYVQHKLNINELVYLILKVGMFNIPG